MVHGIPLRAAAWLLAATSFGWLPAQLHTMARAQGVVGQPAPTGQPMWVNPTPMLQVGPNGAVNLDQPMPYTAAQVPGATYPPQQYVAQPWGAQPVAPQATPAVPWAPATTVASPPPYFFVHRTSVFGEFVYLRPRDAEIAYAMPIAGPVAFGVADLSPVGPIALIDPGYEPAFRVGANLAVSEGNSFAAQYTRLRSETTGAATAGAGTVFFPLVALTPDAIDVIDSVDASALLNINLDLADVDFRGLCAGCECSNYAYAVNYLVGARYAMLDQEFGATFTEDADDFRTVNSDIRFDGAGMRLGLQGERFFPASGLFVYGSGITNVLFGEFDASFREVEVEAGVEDVAGLTSWTAGRVVPVLDLEVGAGWLGMNRHLRLSAGYRVSAWFNVVKTEDWIQAVQSSDYRDLDGTLTFDGVVARAEWLF